MSDDLSNLQKFLTVHQIAEYLGISARTLYRIVEEGKIGHIKISDRCIRIRREAVAAYLAANTHKPAD